MPTPHRDDYALIRYLLRTARELEGADYIAPYKALLSRLIREGKYYDAGDSAEQFMEQAEVAHLLCEEIGLGLISISAVLLEPPYRRGELTQQDVRELCPNGTLDLIERLVGRQIKERSLS